MSRVAPGLRLAMDDRTTRRPLAGGGQTTRNAGWTMTRSMARWALAGCMALAVLGAAAVLDVGSTAAEAAPSVSPFAGTYSWDLAETYAWDRIPVTISDGGRIAGAAYAGGGEFGYALDVSISGWVNADGRYSFKRNVTIYYYDGRKRQHVSHASFQFTGNMAPDADGNLVGTADIGESFLWVRQ